MSISKIIADTVKVDHDLKHAFGYGYSSADAIYSAVRESIAKHEYRLWMHEAEKEWRQNPIVGTEKLGAPILVITYEIALVREGEDVPPPEQRERVTVGMEITKVQNFGALRTSALKFYIRSALFLPTGEREESNGNGSAMATSPKPVVRRGQGSNLRPKDEEEDVLIVSRIYNAFRKLGIDPSEPLVCTVTHRITGVSRDDVSEYTPEELSSIESHLLKAIKMGYDKAKIEAALGADTTNTTGE